jgi:NitT/TauT family transport system substrate-binding protein
VTLVQGNGSGNTAQLVANGRAQLAYADAVAVMQLIAKGAPMKIVSTVYQSNPNAVMSLKKAGIKSIADLKGKKVGVPSGSSQTTMLPLLLKANNLKESDINMIDMPVASMVPALLQGQVDAVLGSIDAYQIQAEAQGAQLDVYRFADYGVPTVSTSIFASNDFLKSNPDVVKKFVAASLKGWSFALDKPEQAIKDVKKVFPEVNEKLATAELAAITPLFCSGGAKYIGKAEDPLWAKSQDLLSEVKLLPAGRIRRPTTAATTCPPRARCARANRKPSCREGSRRRRWSKPATRTKISTRDVVPQPGRTITEADIVAFAGLTGDYSELHTSEVYARNSQFGRRVAHGMLGLAFAHGLMWPRTGELRETAIAFPRHQRLEVRRADLRRRHHLRRLPLAELRDSESRPTQAIAIFDVELVNQDGEVVQRGRKALLVSKVPLSGVEASRSVPRRSARDERRHARQRPRPTRSPASDRHPVGIQDLRRGHRAAVPRAEDHSVDIEAGEFVSVVGPSGCGKSTLMLMVAGLLERSVGDIAIDGRSVTQPVTDVGIAFQDHLLLDFRTALANVTLHADIRKLPKKQIEARAKSSSRSSGSRRRWTSIRASSPAACGNGSPHPHARPRSVALLMDEPFGALDALTRLQVRTDLEALWLRRRPTVLFITHSVEEASDSPIASGDEPEPRRSDRGNPRRHSAAASDRAR